MAQKSVAHKATAGRISPTPAVVFWVWNIWNGFWCRLERYRDTTAGAANRKSGTSWPAGWAGKLGLVRDLPRVYDRAWAATSNAQVLSSSRLIGLVFIFFRAKFEAEFN